MTCFQDDAPPDLRIQVTAPFRRSVTISASRRRPITRFGFASDLALAPGEQWSASFAVSPHATQPGVWLRDARASEASSRT